MPSTALYTDLSGYYDLMCADINYLEQSLHVCRLHQLFGNNGKRYLDLACGTGPHVKHFIDAGYEASGLDINQPMLDIAQRRCPSAQFSQQDMSSFKLPVQFDLITCFLYSIHYNENISKLRQCIRSVYEALSAGGLFCFNAVDKNTIDNREGIKNSLEHEQSHFTFQSSWFYTGEGEQQTLRLSIEKRTAGHTERWNDQHAMVAVSFEQLQQLLQPYFDVHIFEHDFDKIIPWRGATGNALFVGVKQ